MLWITALFFARADRCPVAACGQLRMEDDITRRQQSSSVVVRGCRPAPHRRAVTTSLLPLTATTNTARQDI